MCPLHQLDVKTHSFVEDSKNYIWNSIIFGKKDESKNLEVKEAYV